MTAVATPLRERPILFSGPMVRAILEGRKTQTRRVVKGAPAGGNWKPFTDDGSWYFSWMGENPSIYPRAGIRCPYGQLGDRLWVRECFHLCPHCTVAEYRADPDDRPLRRKCAAHGWSPSIHMPRAVSRVTLEITDVRVERLQEITEEDAQAEGISTSVVDPSPRGVAPIYPKQYVHAVECFRDLWDSLNAARGFSWNSSPWVWVVSFRPVEGA